VASRDAFDEYCAIRAVDFDRIGANMRQWSIFTGIYQLARE